jgi:hypothetical protein
MQRKKFLKKKARIEYSGAVGQLQNVSLYIMKLSEQKKEREEWKKYWVNND